MLKYNLRQTFAVTGVALSLAAHGCSHGFLALLIAMFTDHEGNRLTDHQISWIGSIITITKICGTFVSPLLMSRFGRQKCHLISTVPALTSWIVFAYGNSIPALIVARLMQGVSMGLHAPMVTILIAEYTDPVNRGAFLGTLPLSVGLGVIWVHLWGNILTLRTSALVCAVIPLITLFIVFLSPETPSWLVVKGRHQEARKVFKWLRGDGITQHSEIDDLIESVKNDIDPVNKLSKFAKFKEDLRNFRRKEFYKPVLIAVSMLICFEFGGSHFIPSYGNIILQSVLNKTNIKDVSWHLTLLDFLKSISGLVALLLLKMIKRRTIIFTSGVMTILSFIAISVLIYSRNIFGFEQEILVEILPMALMVLYTVSCNLGLSPVTFVIIGEIFPLSIRNLGTTMTMTMLSVNYILVMKTSPHLYTHVGVEGAFLLYSGVMALSLYVVYLLLPETKDKTLLAIENTLRAVEKCDVEVEMKLMDK